ncbi:hypothetical protein Emag_000255 [Eimeria magna]
MEPQEEVEPQGAPPPYVDLEAHLSADEEAALRLHRQLNEEGAAEALLLLIGCCCCCAAAAAALENLLQGERTLVPYVYDGAAWRPPLRLPRRLGSGMSTTSNGSSINSSSSNSSSSNSSSRESSSSSTSSRSSSVLDSPLESVGCAVYGQLVGVAATAAFTPAAAAAAATVLMCVGCCRSAICMQSSLIAAAFVSAASAVSVSALHHLLHRALRNIENEALIESRDSSLIPSLSLENVIGGVSSLLGGPQGGGSQSPREDSRGAPLGAPMQPQGPSISVNKCCPICMVDLADDDTVLIMPCDSRVFFVLSPICRANIVRLITGAATPPQGDREGGLEMQI